MQDKNITGQLVHDFHNSLLSTVRGMRAIYKSLENGEKPPEVVMKNIVARIDEVDNIWPVLKRALEEKY
jgi:hypothetical protein